MNQAACLHSFRLSCPFGILASADSPRKSLTLLDPAPRPVTIGECCKSQPYPGFCKTGYGFDSVDSVAGAVPLAEMSELNHKTLQERGQLVEAQTIRRLKGSNQAIEGHRFE